MVGVKFKNIGPSFLTKMSRPILMVEEGNLCENETPWHQYIST